VESWRDYFSSIGPFLAAARKQAILQPVPNKVIVESFFVVLTARKENLLKRKRVNSRIFNSVGVNLCYVEIFSLMEDDNRYPASE